MMIDLGTLGGKESCALAINSAGHIVGWAQTEDGSKHAFLWTPEKGMTRLDIPGSDSSRALAINDSDQIVGHVNDADDDAQPQFFSWTPGNGVQIIPPVPNALIDAEIKSINSKGQVLISTWDADEEGEYNQRHALIWSEQDGFREVHSPLDYHAFDYCSITENSDIIGWGMDSGPFSDYLYSSFIIFQDGRFGILPDHWKGTNASYCNRHGQIAGKLFLEFDISKSFLSTDTQACRWTPLYAETNQAQAEQRSKLNNSSKDKIEFPSYKTTLTGAFNDAPTESAGINSSGEIAGNAYEGNGIHRAFFWSKDTGIIAIGALGDSGSYAWGINDSGTIVGSSKDSDGNTRAFVWYKPEQLPNKPASEKPASRQPEQPKAEFDTGWSKKLNHRLVTPFLMWGIVALGFGGILSSVPHIPLFHRGVISIIISIAAFAHWLVFFTSAILDNHSAARSAAGVRRLATDGVYARVRHPIYSADIVLAWGVFLLFPTLRALLCVLWMCAILIIWMKVEERALLERFGQDYADYMRRTPMSIPRYF